MLNKSQTQLNLPAVSTQNTYYGKFLNNGSDILAVNGSVTPVEFKLDLPSTQELMIERVTFIIESNSIIDMNNFASISQLTNGILFIVNENIAPIKAEAIIKNNGDVLLISTDTTINTIRKSEIEDAGIISGSWDFTASYSGNCPMVINNDLKIIIRDDLSAVSFFKVSCHAILLD